MASSKRSKLARAIVAAGLAWPLVAWAQDVVFKTDGGRLRGTILKETSRGVRIKTAGGTIFVPRDDIAEVRRDGDVFREFERRRRALDASDERAWYRLGVWAQSQELYPQAIDCFHEVLRLEPDHEEARWELGYRRSSVNGRWVTESTYFQEKGYRRWEDRWVPPDEYSKYAAGMEKVDGRWLTPAEAARRRAAEDGESLSASAANPARRKKAARDARAAKAPRARARGPARWFGGGRPLGGQVGGKPLSPEEREAARERAKAQGGWAVATSSKYYDVFSNGPAKEVESLARLMDVMCEEYKRIFHFDRELTRPFPVHLYANQREFMRRTGKGPGVGGFYDGRKIVGFHGKLGNLSTSSVLFHEGTHQFQGLVLGRNMWQAKIWLIEGLAVYFEACKVQGRRLRVEIPTARLAAVRRAIRSGTYVPLATLIRMEQAQFGALHYAHAWSLIHFLVNGAGGGKKRFVEYWEKTKEGGRDGVALFEEIFNRPLAEIEAAWKDYVLNRLGRR